MFNPETFKSSTAIFFENSIKKPLPTRKNKIKKTTNLSAKKKKLSVIIIVNIILHI